MHVQEKIILPSSVNLKNKTPEINQEVKKTDKRAKSDYEDHKNINSITYLIKSWWYFKRRGSDTTGKNFADIVLKLCV